MAQTGCEIKDDKIKTAKRAVDARFECKKCSRRAKKKKHLCKPVKLTGKSL
jgi:hypothetical protein